MQSGVAAYVDFASVQPFCFTFCGTQGQIVIDQWGEGFELMNYELQDQRPNRPWFSYSPIRAVRRRFYPSRPHPVPMQAAVRELVVAIHEDREPRRNGADGRAAVELALAIHASAARDDARIHLPLEDHKLRVVSR